MSKVNPGNQEPLSPFDLARENLELARRLDTVHPLGQTILSAFEQDVILAELDSEVDGTTIIEQPSITQVDALLDTDDVELIKRELQVRAEHSLSLVEDLGDSNPGEYDAANRSNIVRGNKGALSKNLLGKTLLVRSIFTQSTEVSARLVLIGGLEDEYPIPPYREIPPNPRLHILQLRPFQKEDGTWSWYNGPGYYDAEQLGQIPNCCFRQSSFTAPIMDSYGHSRAYDIDLGVPSFNMPDSLNPADIEIAEPKSVIDHLVKNATEAARIEERLFDLKFPKVAVS